MAIFFPPTLLHSPAAHPRSRPSNAARQSQPPGTSRDRPAACQPGRRRWSCNRPARLRSGRRRWASGVRFRGADTSRWRRRSCGTFQSPAAAGDVDMMGAVMPVTGNQPQLFQPGQAIFHDRFRRNPVISSICICARLARYSCALRLPRDASCTASSCASARPGSRMRQV